MAGWFWVRLTTTFFGVAFLGLIGFSAFSSPPQPSQPIRIQQVQERRSSPEMEWIDRMSRYPHPADMSFSVSPNSWRMGKEELLPRGNPDLVVRDPSFGNNPMTPAGREVFVYQNPRGKANLYVTYENNQPVDTRQDW